MRTTAEGHQGDDPLIVRIWTDRAYGVELEMAGHDEIGHAVDASLHLNREDALQLAAALQTSVGIPN